jgi:hypothetical protein
MYRVMFMFLAAQGQNYLETFKLQAATGIEAQLLPVAEFYKQLITRAINPFIQKMAQFSASQIKPFQTDLIDDTVPGQVAPQLAASMDSVSIWHLMDMFADRPWNELFVEDQEDGPHVVFRQAPYKDYDGDALILQGAKDPGEVSIDSAEVVSSSLQRSDGRVANFYWVPPGMTQMDSAMLTTAAMLAQGYPIDLAHDANTPTIYGQRMMQAGTNLVPGDVAQPIVMLPKAAKDRAANATVTWAHARASQLMALNRDNVLFDEGSLVVMGRETLVAGKYLKLTRGDIESSMYIQSVAHQFLPLQGWSTHLRVIRGTGYRVRTTHPGQPWVVEGYRGPYS